MEPLILLVRHAQADHRAGYLYGRTPGVRLSDTGREQAKRLAVRLEPVKLRAIYSSPMERCLETAEAVAAGRRLDIRIEEGLNEVEYGKWRGRSFKSLAKTKLWRTVQRVPSHATFPEGESVLQMQQRGVEAIEAIRARHRRGAVGVFSHADMIKAIVAHYLGMHIDLFQRLVIDLASVTTIGFVDELPRVLRVGDLGEYEMFAPKPKRG